ncbi:DUF5518 domain-containing protein [Natronorubrum bangense]|uniref:Uncharacterized protein n=2 Tax=Natronorubrum bangense TaxID=61858 RepID=L9WF59_9EURY|nr:DUF5518 domain-containing protein [Natronorubrum bangense]ELY46943.1 hypothetical protein C494_13641 [Natronorubrum bangense JCM 10635]QCC56524.1 hypothetical protein DV706_18650 [Natronorubrum bangense]
MNRLQAISDKLSNEVWRYAIIVGLASTPFTIILYWQSYPDFSHPISPVFFAGVLVGYISNKQDMDTRQIGKRTGLVAAVPVLWPFFDLLVFISGFSQPTWFSGFQVMAIILMSIVITVVSVLIGMIGAILGDWLAGKMGNYSLMKGQFAT